MPTELRAPECHTPKDPYEVIRQAYLVGTDTESEPFKDAVETEVIKSPYTVAPPTSLPNSTPPILVPILHRTARMAVRVPPTMSPSLSTSMAEVAAMSDSAFWDDDEEEDNDEADDDKEEEDIEVLDSNSKSEDVVDEGPTVKDKDHAARDEGLLVGDEGPGIGVESLSLGRDDDVPEGQSSGFIPESERPERVSTLRRPTLTTWIDPKDDIAYIDVPTYPPPAPPAQILSSPEWSSGSLPISLEPSIVLLPISSPMIPLTIPSPVASPATTEAEGFFTELGAQVEMQGGLIRDHMEKTVVTFRALCRPVLALEAWAGHVNNQMEDMSRAGYDDQRLVHDMLLQSAALQQEL
nr:hypothetical protein [Tanacetum cinerariifolium]